MKLPRQPRKVFYLLKTSQGGADGNETLPIQGAIGGKISPQLGAAFGFQYLWKLFIIDFLD